MLGHGRLWLYVLHAVLYQGSPCMRQYVTPQPHLNLPRHAACLSKVRQGYKCTTFGSTPHNGTCAYSRCGVAYKAAAARCLGGVFHYPTTDLCTPSV
jgi:hypothetical protein